jgi:hypothetical protein
MRCKGLEKSIYLYYDGLLNKEEAREVDAHLSSCPRCSRTAQEAKRSLAVLQQPDLPGMLLSREKQESLIYEKLYTERVTRRPVILQWKRFAYPVVAVAAIAVLSVVSGFFMIGGAHRDRGPVPGVSLLVHHAPVTVSTALTDTTISFDRLCAFHAGNATTVVMDRHGRRSVSFDLSKGNILIAAHKGFYDTIAVRSGPLTVYATGTHFSVERNDDFISASVLEGTVKLLNNRAGGEMILGCGEFCSVSLQDASWKKEPLSIGMQRQLAEEFEAMGSADVWPLASDSGRHQNRRSAGVSPAQGRYPEIRGLLRQGEWDKAIAAITKYLDSNSGEVDMAYCDLALCYSKLHRYEDAISAYEKAALATRDTLVREAALHKINSVCFSKLRRYAEAEAGIKKYLAAFPAGNWREQEYLLLIRVKTIRKNLPEAQQVLQRFMSEFPTSCRVAEAQEEVSKLAGPQ